MTEQSLGKIAGFELLSKIGQGGMGAVYRARQLSMERVVAVKILPPELARDPLFVQQFLREARSAGQLDHPNIVRALDVGEADGYYYFAMEYIEGESAAARLARGERFSPLEVASIGEQIARALDHAWHRGILHRDIKPGNILINRHGVAKLADFGLARRISDTAEGTRAEGTPLYISPEQATGKGAIDVRSDIYSLGATLYHMLCGQTPFTGRTHAEIIRQHLHVPATPPHERFADLPRPLSDLLTRTLAKDPSLRPKDAARLADSFAAIRRSLETASLVEPQRLSRRRRRSPVLALLSLLIAVVAAGAAIVVLLPRMKSVVGTATALPTAPEQTSTEFSPVAHVHSPVVAVASPPPAPSPAEHLFARQAEVFRSIEENVRELLAANNPTEALARIGAFPHDLRDGYIEQKLDALRREVMARILAAFDAADLSIRELLRDGDLDSAARRLEQLKERTPSTLRERLAALEALVHKAQAEHEEAIRHAAQRQYQEFLLALMSPLAEKRFDAALEHVEAAQADPAFAPLADTLGEDRRIVQHVASLLTRAETNAQQMLGQSISLRNYRGEIVKAEDGTIFLNAGEAVLGLKLTTLPSDELIRLAAPPQGEADEPWFQAAAILLVAENNLKAAAEVLQKARERGLDTALIERRIETVTEARAERDFQRLASLAEQGAWPAVLAGVDTLRKNYAHTAAVRNHAAELTQYALRSRLGGFRIEDFFHCRIIHIDDQQVELVYDFSTRAQFSDWIIRRPDGEGEPYVNWSQQAVQLSFSGGTEDRSRAPRDGLLFVLPFPMDPANWSLDVEFIAEGRGPWSAGTILWDGARFFLFAGLSRESQLGDWRANEPRRSGSPELILAGVLSSDARYYNPSGENAARQIVLALRAWANRYQFTYRTPDEPAPRTIGTANTPDRFTFVGFLVRAPGALSMATITARRVRLVGSPDPEWFRRAARSAPPAL